jgi:hypothetical protein
MSNNVVVDEEVDIELLKRVHEKFVALAKQKHVPIPEFGNPKLPDNQLLIAFQQYLKDLSWILGGETCNKCWDGTCPPCWRWTPEQYEDYLSALTSS